MVRQHSFRKEGELASQLQYCCSLTNLRALAELVVVSRTVDMDMTLSNPTSLLILSHCFHALQTPRPPLSWLW